MADKTEVIRMFEAFAGIGAQRKALDNNKIKYKISGMAEWYIPAIVSYQAIHNNLTLENIINHDITIEQMVDYLESKPLSMDSKNLVTNGFWKRKKLDELRIIYKAVKMSEEEGNIFDVRKLHERKLNGIDLLTYSFPCQDLSQQGKQKGMSKGAETRSGLLWEIEKALDSTNKKNLPKYLLMENVIALVNKNNKIELKMWLDKLESLGYKNDIRILNAGDFGSSQARRRVFMISSRGKKIELPFGKMKPKSINEILNNNPKLKDFMPALDKFDITDFKLTKSNINKSSLINYSTFNSESYIYDKNYTGPTLTASGANSRIKILHENKVRKLDAQEAYRYMGFDKEDYQKVNNLNYLTETKIIYTCGNSISVEVLEEIMKNIERGM